MRPRLGLNAFGRPVAMLNYTSGFKNLSSALKTGQIRQIVSSRRFVDKANLQDLADQLATVECDPGRTVDIVNLEDVRLAIGWRDKLGGVISAKFARRLHRSYRTPPRHTGVVLFTSGTEGVVGSIPVLGSGKTDFPATLEMVRQTRPML